MPLLKNLIVLGTSVAVLNESKFQALELVSHRQDSPKKF